MLKSLCTLGIGCLLITGGCSRLAYDKAPQTRTTGIGDAEASKFATAPPSATAASNPSAPSPDPVRRFIAVRHKLTVETPEAQLAKAWESMAAYCEKIRCEIVVASFTERIRYEPPSGNLLLRVAPEDLKGLLGQIRKTGAILEHRTGSEDKTAAAIDLDAQVTNVTEYRDRLRSMVSKSTGGLTEVLEVNRELVRVQTELDSAVARRRLLTSETDKATVEITFVPRASVVATGALEPLARALRRAAGEFAESLAALISVVVVMLPWVAAGVAVVWVAMRVVRRRHRRARAGESPAPHRPEDGSMRPNGG